MHTAAHRVLAGFLTAMESTWPEGNRQTGLTIVADMINHRGEVGPGFRKKLDDFAKPLVHGIKAGPHGSIVRRDRTAVLLRAAFEHPVQVFRLPPESHGQGFERATATAALHGMPLDFAHDGCGHMRTLRKLALTPAKLADTVADSPSDRSPVPWIAFRHAFLRAPLPAPRLAGRCAIPRQTGTNRNQAKAFRNKHGAEISSISMISAGPVTMTFAVVALVIGLGVLALLVLVLVGIRDEERRMSLTGAPRTRIEAVTRRLLGVGVRHPGAGRGTGQDPDSPKAI
jgi:hypothetical protein